jgi:transposase-like protein
MVTPPREARMRRRYSPEFRRKVLDLLKAGRKVVQIAADLGVTAQTIYTWQKQELIDTGQIRGRVQYR